MTGTSFSLFSLALAGLALSACSSTPAATPGAYADLNLEVSGQGNWSIECTGTNHRGATFRLDQDARGSDGFATLFHADTTLASCSYTAGDAPFTIELVETGFDCPFGAYDNGVCTLTAAAGSEDGFEVAG